MVAAVVAAVVARGGKNRVRRSFAEVLQVQRMTERICWFRRRGVAVELTRADSRETLAEGERRLIQFALAWVDLLKSEEEMPWKMRQGQQGNQE